MIALSSGVRWRWLDSQGLMTIFEYGVIEVYGGAQPANANAAVTPSNRLGQITSAGLPFTPGLRGEGGLLLYQPYIGFLANPPGALWKLNVTQTGTATWFRFLGNAYDPGGIDTLGDFPRMDGAVNDGLYLVSTSLTAGQSIPIGGCFISFEA